LLTGCDWHGGLFSWKSCTPARLHDWRRAGGVQRLCMGWQGRARRQPGRCGAARLSPGEAPAASPTPPAAHFVGKGAQQDVIQQGTDVWVHLAKGAGLGCLRGGSQQDRCHR
jgi:hypothetical protein